jgi:ferredoxin
MRIQIDSEKCTGHGRCYSVAPEVFDSDESGYGVLLGSPEVHPEFEELARRARENCPEGAISIS